MNGIEVILKELHNELKAQGMSAEEFLATFPDKLVPDTPITAYITLDLYDNFTSGIPQHQVPNYSNFLS